MSIMEDCVETKCSSYLAIGAAIEVHKILGPGLLESVYEICLCSEFIDRGMNFQKQVSLPVLYKGKLLDCGYRLDFIIDNRVIIELKSVEKLLPVHDAQLLTYLKLANLKTGLLINFNVPYLNVPYLKDGIRRFVL